MQAISAQRCCLTVPATRQTTQTRFRQLHVDHEIIGPAQGCTCSRRQQQTVTYAVDKQSEPPALPAEAAEDDAKAELAGFERSVKGRRKADSSDWISSNLTRRFGLAGGLAWAGILTFGVVFEQIKTRREQAQEERGGREVTGGTETVLPSGTRFTDIALGGGQPVQKGFLMVLDYRATASGQEFEDTKKRGKPIVFLYGSRPLTGGLCRGVEEAMQGMRAGGRRKAIVPPSQGFGDDGFTLRPTEHVSDKRGSVPPGATLEYELSLVRVSIPPS